MKGVDALIASVLIILISITAIFIALQLGNPSVQKAKEILLMQEGKNNLVSIDNVIKNVLVEGEGSTRVLKFSTSGGSYKIDKTTNSITFSMESFGQIIAEGSSKIEDGINFTGKTGMVFLNLSYENIQIIDSDEFGRGHYTLTIRNDGYNVTTQKQMIYISSVPPLQPPLVTFTNQYNQSQTIVIEGVNTTFPINLNMIDGQTYNITENGTTVNMFDTSLDLESGMQQKKVTPTQNWYNFILNDSNSGNVGDTYVSESSKTSNYGTATTFIVASRNLARNARAYLLWSLSGIPTGAIITNANMSFNMTTAPSSGRRYTAYNTTKNWDENNLTWNLQPTIGTLQDNKSNVTANKWIYWNVTNAAITAYSQANKNMSIMVRDSVENASSTNYQGTFISKEGTSMQRPKLNITYYNYSILTDQNTTDTTYGNVLSTPIGSITNISVTVNVSAYSSSGSSGRNSAPDLWIEVWNGSIWSAVGNMSITGTGNKTLYVSNQGNIYTWWANNPTQRNFTIKGRYFDANATAWDEINYTDVWVRIDSKKTTYRAEIEHNATGVSWSGTLRSINISLKFSTNVTSDFNLKIYNFYSGSWDYTSCQSGTANENTWYNWWCNITSNPSFYDSLDGKVSFRLSGTAHYNLALIREDYVQYYISYVQ